MNVPLEAAQVEVIQSIRIAEIQATARYEQRMQDLADQRTRLITLFLKQQGITSGSYDLNEEGTCILDKGEEKKKAAIKKK